MIPSYILDECKNADVESLVDSWRPQISELAAFVKVNSIDVERQIRLHLPGLEFKCKPGEKFPAKLREIIVSRFAGYDDFHNYYLLNSGASQLLGLKTNIKNKGIYHKDSLILNIVYGNVSDEVGTLIETKLHYLRKPRSDAKMRVGLFIEGFSLPICYMSFCPVSRYYQTFTLQSVLNQKQLYSRKVMQLARVYGFGNLPANSISKLMSYSVKKLVPNFVEYIITAINPFIGFNGTSMVASGFKPFAYCNVSYKYDKNNEYCNRRNSMDQADEAKLNTPPNLLLVKGVTKGAIKRVSAIDQLVDVPVLLFNDVSPITEHLNTLRDRLEDSWSELTAYHGTPKSSKDPISKGQCGVTTAYLAKEFEKRGYEVLFCEGDAYFPDGIKPITNHCWLKIPYFREAIAEYYNIIVDLTSDQNGFNESIICDTTDNLAERSIFYKSKSEIPPSTIHSENLIERLNILKNSIESLDNN